MAKRRRIAQNDIPRLLSDAGFSYYENGTLSRIVTGEKTHIFFTGDCKKGVSISSVLAKFPEAELMTKRSEFAPEHKARMIAFPKKTQLHYIESDDENVMVWGEPGIGKSQIVKM